MTQGKDASCMGLRMVLPFLSKMAKLRSTLFTQGTWDALIGNPTKKPHNVEEFLGIWIMNGGAEGSLGAGLYWPLVLEETVS